MMIIVMVIVTVSKAVVEAFLALVVVTVMKEKIIK